VLLKRLREDTLDETIGELIEQWVIEFHDTTHCHSPSLDASAHPSRRRESFKPGSPAYREAVFDLTHWMKPGAVYTKFRVRFPGILVTISDLYNLKKKIRIEKLGGRTPLEALVYGLSEDSNQRFITESILDSQRRLQGFFVATQETLEFYRSYPDILSVERLVVI
jgi:hypothetical protein